MANKGGYPKHTIAVFYLCTEKAVLGALQEV